MALVERFIADTAAWDKSLKNAVFELNRVTAEVQKQGKSFAAASKEDVEFARSLGQIQTKAKDVRGQMSELNSALVNMKTRFNQLSAAEKQSQFGKALQGSITQVEARMKDLSSAMPQTTSSLGSLRGAVDALGGVSLLKMASAAGAVSLALEGFKKIVAGSQTATDAYGRSMEAMKRVTDGFWESISRGNLDNFIRSLGDVARLAKEAYNAMDLLSTFNASDQRQQSEFNLRRSKLRANIRSGVDVEESKKALKELEQEEMAYYKRMSTVRKEAAYAQLKSQTGARNGQWVARYASMGEGGQAAAARDAAAYKAQHSHTESVTVNHGNTVSTSDRTVWDSREAEERYNAMVNFSQMSDEVLRGIQDTFASANQARQTYYDKIASDARLQRAGADSGTGGSGSGGSTKDFAAPKIETRKIEAVPLVAPPTESMAQLEEQLSMWKQRLHEATTTAAYEEAQNMIAKIQEQIDVQPLAIRLGVSTEAALQLKSTIDEQLSGLEFEPIPITYEVDGHSLTNLSKTSDETKKHLNGVANAFTGIGGALQQIDDPGAKVAGLIMSAIGNTAAAFGTAQTQAAAMGPWAWIAFAVTGLATMIATITGIKNATAGSYASGGIVPGNSYHGDALTANVNSGELIMSVAQQDNVAAAITASPMSDGLNMSMEVHGTKLISVIRNELKASGIKGSTLSI